VSVYTLKIKMQSQTFILDPPLAEARASLYTQLHDQIEVICGLRRWKLKDMADTKDKKIKET